MSEKLEEFELWQKKVLSKHYNSNVYLGAKLGWIAALGWMLEELKIEEPYGDFVQRLKEELNAKT